MSACTFFGHRQIHENIEPSLLATLESPLRCLALAAYVISVIFFVGGGALDAPLQRCGNFYALSFDAGDS